MTKKLRQSYDTITNEIVGLTPEQERTQTAYLNSLPKDEQIKLAAATAGMSVTDLLIEIATLNAEIAKHTGTYDGITGGQVPFKDIE